MIVIDIAHGHSVVMARAIDAFRKQFGDARARGRQCRHRRGRALPARARRVNGIKVGIGPGGGCTTRLNTNFGVPQVQALVECRDAAGGRVPLIADGGVKRDGALVQALLFGGDTVMLGSALAGTTETPGDIVQKPVVVPESHKTVRVPFKVFRGMASLQAIVDRLDVEDAEASDVEALGAEGMEIAVPARGSVRPVHPRHAEAPDAPRSATAARTALPSCRRCSGRTRRATSSGCRNPAAANRSSVRSSGNRDSTSVLQTLAHRSAPRTDRLNSFIVYAWLCPPRCSSA